REGGRDAIPEQRSVLRGRGQAGPGHRGRRARSSRRGAVCQEGKRQEKRRERGAKSPRQRSPINGQGPRRVETAEQGAAACPGDGPRVSVPGRGGSSRRYDFSQ